MARIKTLFFFATIIICGSLCGYMLHILLHQDQYIQQDAIKKRLFKNLHEVQTTKDIKHKEDLEKKQNDDLQHNTIYDQKVPKISDDLTHSNIKSTDRLPIRVFINCGGTYPYTLDLFYSTYPNSWEYQVHTFMEDSSYKILYKKFPNHILHTSVIASYKKANETRQVNNFGTMLSINKELPHFDLSLWLMETFLRDDYVILKTDTLLEEQAIIHRMVSNGAVNWVDKFYTTTKNETLLKILNKELELATKKVSVWDNELGTYDDFNQRNPEEIPKGGHIDKCFGIDEAQFALVLFSECMDAQTLLTINDIIAYAGERKVAISFALPIEFFKNKPEVAQKLFELFSVGLLLESIHSGASIDISDEITERYYYRNQVVYTSHVLKKNTGNTLQYAVVKENINDHIIDELENSRHLTVVTNIKDITKEVKNLLRNNTLKMDSIGTIPGNILSINLNHAYSNIFSLYIVKKMEPWLVPLHKCRQASENNPSSSDVTTTNTETTSAVVTTDSEITTLP